jgi:AcrB/AcrD/AcrF family
VCLLEDGVYTKVDTFSGICEVQAAGGESRNAKDNAFRRRVPKKGSSLPSARLQAATVCFQKMMTVMAILVGLLPIMWSHGAGADVMKRIAAPMIGGVISSFLLELMVYPAIYEVWRKIRLHKGESLDLTGNV